MFCFGLIRIKGRFLNHSNIFWQGISIIMKRKSKFNMRIKMII